MANHESPASGMLRAPELLAPSGNWECATAAIENGADAIYFGLQIGFNARARAANFTLDDLPELMNKLHRRSVLGYVTLNTLVFTDELSKLEENVRRLSDAGVDAVLVQDVGAARLIREVAPHLTIHASTQMTMVSAETIAAIECLGIERVVLARELSIAEIAKISSMTTMPLECFVHGALCVAYSGQCLTSESLGGRSANRGQCAQACRLDYKLYSDGKLQELGPNQYLLSPQDLAGYDFVPELIKAGICSLKIEGRLKTPEYVANTVSHYRQAIDAAVADLHQPMSVQQQRDIAMSFSRGLSPGWLEGCDHKRLVPGLSSSKRGVFVGTVVGQKGQRLVVDLQHPIAKGDGIVLEGDRRDGSELGGRVYDVFVNGRPMDEAQTGRVEWLFQRGLIRDRDDRIQPGQRIYQTDDPKLARRLRSTFEGKHPNYRRPVEIHVDAKQGEPIRISVAFQNRTFEIQGDEPLAEASRHPLSIELLREQLGRLGGTAYILGQLTADISGKPLVPFSVLGKLRHEIVEKLNALLASSAPRKLGLPERTKVLLASVFTSPVSSEREGSHDLLEPELHVLCRSLKQLDTVLPIGIKTVYADFHDIREYRTAVEKARQFDAEIYLATLRIQKPGEIGLFKALAKQEAGGWLVRNLAALRFAHENNIRTIADFSLNVTNPLTAEWLMQQGASRVTASYDLNRDQLLELVDQLPPSWLETVIHQHMPMFHMEHCVFCSVLSPGTNKSNCGRPCDEHSVQLQDRVGVKHTLHADIGCRNTLFNGVAQSGAEAVRGLIEKGIRHFRIELLNDAPPEEVAKLIELYQQLLRGEIIGSQVWKALKADNRVGVTRGTMEQPRNPLAII